MLLREQQVVFGEVIGVESGIDVTLEREQRLLGVARGERRCPTAVASNVQRRQLVGEVHQFADLRRRVATKQFDQLL